MAGLAGQSLMRCAEWWVISGRFSDMVGTCRQAMSEGQPDGMFLTDEPDESRLERGDRFNADAG